MTHIFLYLSINTEHPSVLDTLAPVLATLDVVASTWLRSNSLVPEAHSTQIGS
jgi:hypothetical protein